MAIKNSESGVRVTRSGHNPAFILSYILSYLFIVMSLELLRTMLVKTVKNKSLCLHFPAKNSGKISGKSLHSEKKTFASIIL